MQSNDERDDREHSSWPYASLLLFGYFGSGTPVGRRLRNRSWAALLTFLGAIVVAPFTGRWAVAHVVVALAMPGAVAVIVWAYMRYLGELDELSRLIQLEALAFSYGAVMTVAAIWFGFFETGLQFTPRTTVGTLFVSLLTAEPARGVALAVLARRRQ